MPEIEEVGASEQWSARLQERVNGLVGLASTSSSKYDEFKRWLGEELGANPAVCYLSELGKQWTARVGQALMGLPSLLVLLIEGEPQSDAVKRLEKLHGYVGGLEATLVFFGSEGAWALNALVGVPGRSAFDTLRGAVNSTRQPADGVGRPRVARPSGSFFDLEPEAQAQRIWTYLVGLGPMPVAEAIATAAKALREDGALDYTRLRTDGLVYSELEAAMAYASRRGYLFDRPRPGEIRAIKSDADEFTREDWRSCLLNALTPYTWTERDDVIREAAVQAVDVFGLNLIRLRSGGRVDTALRSALNGLIRLGRIERGSRELIRLAPPTPEGNSDQAELRQRPDPSDRPASAHADESLAVEDVPLGESNAGTAFDHPIPVSSPQQLRRLVGHLPSEAEATFERLLSEAPFTKEDLRVAAHEHLRRFEQAFRNHEFLDMGGAMLLKNQADLLLEAWDGLNPEQRLVAQAAIRYFVVSEEADDDFVIDGLRTDKAVMAAVLEAIL